MKVKLAANAELDLLNKSELDDALGQHAALLTGGVRFRRIEQQFSGTGVITFAFTPSVGFLWSVRAVSVQKPTASTDPVQVWLNSVNPLSFINTIADDGQHGNYASYPKGAVTVQPGSSLIVQCVAATGVGYAAIAVEEVQVGQEWRL